MARLADTSSVLNANMQSLSTSLQWALQAVKLLSQQVSCANNQSCMQMLCEGEHAEQLLLTFCELPAEHAELNRGITDCLETLRMHEQGGSVTSFMHIVSKQTCS